MAECSHDCGSCGENCPSRQNPNDFLEKLNDASSVKRVIGVVSGKGGVGKSMITSLLAVLFNRRDYKTAILDADITGPSIPKAFGIREKAKGSDFGLLPVRSKTGIDIMSVNLLLPNDTDPVVWRGPVIGGTVKQFWGETIWKDIDYMFIDMPPGTGDVPLTVFQSIPVDGIVIVTSPQELVSMIVGKAVKMAQLMNIPILGVVENMSYYVCPDCGARHSIYGESRIDGVAKEFGVDVIGKMPIDAEVSKCADTGTIELFSAAYLDETADIIEEKTKI